MRTCCSIGCRRDEWHGPGRWRFWHGRHMHERCCTDGAAPLDSVALAGCVRCLQPVSASAPDLLLLVVFPHGQATHGFIHRGTAIRALRALSENNHLHVIFAHLVFYIRHVFGMQHNLVVERGTISLGEAGAAFQSPELLLLQHQPRPSSTCSKGFWAHCSTSLRKRCVSLLSFLLLN